MILIMILRLQYRLCLVYKRRNSTFITDRTTVTHLFITRNSFVTSIIHEHHSHGKLSFFENDLNHFYLDSWYRELNFY